MKNNIQLFYAILKNISEILQKIKNLQSTIYKKL